MELYHGTNTLFEEFSPEFLFSNDSLDQYGSGYYFFDTAGPTVQHGGLVVFADCNIKKILPYEESHKITLTYAQIEELILRAPDLDAKLENFGDLGYEGYDHVLSSAVQLYVGGDICKTLDTVGGDFFDRGKDTHILLRAFSEMTGYNCIHVKARNIWVMLDYRDITIKKVIPNVELP